MAALQTAGIVLPAKARTAETPLASEFGGRMPRSIGIRSPGVAFHGRFRGGKGFGAHSGGWRVKNRGFGIADGGSEHGEQSEVFVVAVVPTSVFLSIGTFAKLRLNGRDGIEIVDSDVFENPKISIGQLVLINHAEYKEAIEEYLRKYTISWIRE